MQAEKTMDITKGNQRMKQKPKTSILRGSWANRYKNWISFIAVVLFILIWEGAYQLGWLNPSFYSSPYKIVVAGIDAFSNGGLLNDLFITAQEFIGGFLIAVVVGVIFGVLMGWYPLINAIMEPFTNALFATPRIVLLPLVTLIFGIGIESKFVLVFLGAVFPILINTMVGIGKIDQNLLRVAKVFNATDMQMFRTLAVPASIPFIITGIRLGMSTSLVTCIASEMMISSGGIGNFVMTASSQFRSDDLFLGIMIVALFGVLLTSVLKRIEARFDSWRVNNN